MKKKVKQAIGIFTVSAQIQGSENELLTSLQKCATRLRAIDIADTDKDEFLILPSYYQPPPKKPFRPRAGPVEAAVVKLVFEIFAAWVGGKILDNIWKAVRSEVKNILLNKRDLELHFKSEINGCCLVIKIFASNKKELDAAVKLIPQAMKKADDWVQARGYTHNYIIYYIKDSNISPIPRLSDQEID